MTDFLECSELSSMVDLSGGHCFNGWVHDLWSWTPRHLITAWDVVVGNVGSRSGRIVAVRCSDDGHSLALDGRCCWARVLDLLKTLSIGETTRERHRVQELGVGRLGSE